MTTNVLEFKIKYQVDEYNLFENNNWIVSLRPEQKTPFSMLISVKFDIFSLSDLTPIQMSELHDCYKFIENLSYKKLEATKVNYLCLMMVDSIVHFHVFPRFNKSLAYKGVSLKDVYYPKPVDILDKNSLNISLVESYLKNL
ncbi:MULTISPECIES: hypothetical protein [Flavobacteriaceae]|uniref:hypothetical protein n=1 Tax=Flavobacteriaceae TaxID=49546 RepID=UPI003AA7AECA